MIKTFLIISLLALFFCGYSSSYHIDDISGDDSNNGLSQSEAWRSIDRVNTVEFHPGDTILFRRGGEWVGNLKPLGSGTPGNRIVIGAYGNGPAPLIDAKGVIASGEKVSYTIRLFNQEYIEIRDLKIKNFKFFEEPRKVNGKMSDSFVYAPKMGIYIEGKDCGTLNQIHLINLEICDINGDMSTKHNGGVFAEITWSNEKSKRIKSNFNGLYTEGCYFHDIDRTGWSNTSVWSNRSLTSAWGNSLANGKIHNWYPSEQIIFRNNKFEKSGANALILRVAAGPLVSHCLFTYNACKGSGNASFPFNCDDALFQYNEACYTVYNSEADSWDNKKDADAGGFDSDWNCKNTIIQYNYSHHNGYGGILICCDGGSKTAFNNGTIVRYNIFEDNRHHVIRTSGPASNNKIYNNVIFSGSELDSVMLIYHKSWAGYSDSTAYLNNIFYSEGKGNYIDLGKSDRNEFLSNTFYGNIKNEPNDSLKSKLNPHFKSSCSSKSNWFNTLRFMLQEDSPEINQGVLIKGHPEYDFLGNKINGVPDRGAFEFIW
jgi:hypothetical protein